MDPQTTPHRGAILGATAGATFLAFLDVTVANLAFPDLQADFSASPLTHLAWVITAYAVAFAALLAPAGRIADVVGRRRLFVGGVVVFAATSAAAAAAPSLEALVAARGAQGAAAAAMIPSSLGLLLANTPPAKAAKAIGVWGAAGAFAAAVGPALGGVLVDLSGWRAVFLINVPVAGAILLAARRIPADGPRTGQLPDPVGTAALAGGIGLLVLAITQAPQWGWTSGRTALAAVLGAAALGWAVLRSRRHSAPAVQVSLWSNHAYAATNAVSVLYGMVLFGWMLLGVLFVVQAWGYSELQAGFAMSPGALGATVGALASGRLVERYGQRAVTITGLVLMGVVAAALYAALGDEPAFLTVWLPAGLISGVGIGFATTGLSSSAAVSVAPIEFAAGLGLNMTARQFGGALGVAALAAYLQWRGPEALLAGFSEAYGWGGVLSLLAAVAAAGLPRRRTPAAAASVAVPEQTVPLAGSTPTG